MEFETDILDVIPEEMPVLKYYGDDYKYKQAYNQRGMYAFVSWKWVRPLAEWIGNRRCLEVMAGRGWLSHGLRELGVDVIATDNYSWHNERGWDRPLTDVLDIDAVDSIDRFGKDIDIVIMSWPYMDNTAFQVLKRLHEVNPNAILLYIGEGNGGCTADDEFHAYFEEVYDEWFLDNVRDNFESWDAIHDYPSIGYFNPNADFDTW